MSSQLVILVAPNFANAELIQQELVSVGYNVIQHEYFMDEKAQDEFLSNKENNGFASWGKNYESGYRGLSYAKIFNDIERKRSVLIATLDELEQLQQLRADVEIFVYFVTDTSKQLLENALLAENVDDYQDKIIDMIRTQVFWGSHRPGMYHSILRNVTIERASLLAKQITDDSEFAIHVDSFDS